MTDLALLFEDGTCDEAASADLAARRRAYADAQGVLLRSYVVAKLDPGADAPSRLTWIEAPGPGFVASLPTYPSLQPRSTGSYRFLRPVVGTRDDEEPRGLLVGLTDCSDAARLEDFHRWYDVHHAADVLRSGLYFRGRRYVRESGDVPEYLAAYETASAEPETFRRYLAWPERDRTRCDVVLVRQVLTFSRIDDAGR